MQRIMPCDTLAMPAPVHRVALAALTASFINVSSAHAAIDVGSSVYIKNHNVWIARGGGTRAHQVTRNGTAGNPFRSPP